MSYYALKENPTIRVSEIFGPTIQGEGVLIGQPTVFVRTGGCDFRCQWCDSLHAVDTSQRQDWHALSVQEIWHKVEALSCNKPLLISLSGGNPAIQPFEGLIRHGKEKGYRFAMETQGSIFKEWFSLLDSLIISPKPPSSAMVNDWQIVAQCLETSAKQTVIKIPVLDEEDYLFARDTAKRFPHVPFYLQPVNHTPPPLEGEDRLDMNGLYQRFQWLIERSLKDQWYDVCILPQLHVFVWGNLRGV